jgi:hypothetical protein
MPMSERHRLTSKWPGTAIANIETLSDIKNNLGSIKVLIQLRKFLSPESLWIFQIKYF